MTELVSEEIITVETVEVITTEVVAEEIVTREVLEVFEPELMEETVSIYEMLESVSVEVVAETVVEREEITECGGQGPPGQDGSVPVLHRYAGEDLGGNRAVYVAADGTFRYADWNSDVARVVAGITTSAATVGSAAHAQYSDEMVEPSWNWTPQEPVFLGANGMLTQTPTSSGVAIVVGIATGTDRILIRIGTPFYLQ